MPTVSRAPNSARILAIILASYLMIVLDVSIVISALPKIHHALGFSATGLSWVQNAYTLAFGALRGSCHTALVALLTMRVP